MQKRILVEIFLPPSGSEFDVTIPTEPKLGAIIGMIASAISDMSNGTYSAMEPVLCDRDTGTIFDINMSAEELGLENGSRLMLI